MKTNTSERPIQIKEIDFNQVYDKYDNNTCCVQYFTGIILIAFGLSIPLGLVGGLNLYNHQCPNGYYSVTGGDCLFANGNYTNYIIINNNKVCPNNTYDTSMCHTNDCMIAPDVIADSVCANTVRSTYDMTSFSLLMSLAAVWAFVFLNVIIFIIIIKCEVYSINKQIRYSNEIRSRASDMLANSNGTPMYSSVA